MVISRPLLSPTPFSPQPITGTLIDGHPSLGCDAITPNAERLRGKIVLLKRGECMFIEKARILEKWGAIGGVILG